MRAFIPFFVTALVITILAPVVDPLLFGALSWYSCGES
jgi:hypothetical protein